MVKSVGGSNLGQHGLARSRSISPPSLMTPNLSEIVLEERKGSWIALDCENTIAGPTQRRSKLALGLHVGIE